MADVVVWRIPLDPATPPGAHAVSALSESERTRAARFATDALRNRWLHGHVAMRSILARELVVPPIAIVYGTGAQGKPFIESPGFAGVEFSYSDADDLALLAISREGPVGVDIERVSASTDIRRVAEARFTPREREELRVAGDDANDRFFRVWARKEALLKAIGAGLAFGLANVEVPATERIGPGLSVTPANTRTAWALEDLDVPEGFRAAIARPVGTSLRWSDQLDR